MEVIFVLTLLFFYFVIVGSVVLGIVVLWRWFWKPDPPPRVFEPGDDLTAFERQLARFYRDGKINDEVYELLLARIRAERAPKTATDNTAEKVVVEKTVVEKTVIEKVVVESVSSPVFDRRVEPLPKPAPPPPPPPKVRRPFTEVLNSFM